MPRRRAKSKLPRLAFEESPVHIIHNPPDPVFASDHPPTADVVPLDQDTTTGWVSPQFQGEPTPGPRRRRHRTQCSTLSMTTRSRHQSGQANQTRSQHPQKQFPALKFIGEATDIQSPPSPSDEISLDENEERIWVRKVNNSKTPNEDGTPISGQCNTPQTQVEDQEAHQPTSDEGESALVKPRVKASTARRKIGKFKKKKGRLKDLAAQLDFTPEAEPGIYGMCNNGLDVITEGVKDKTGTVGYGGRGSNTSDKKNVMVDSPGLTQLRPRSKQRPERKRLFDPHLCDYDDGSSVDNCMNEFDLIKPRSQRCNGRLVTKISSPLCQTPRQNGRLQRNLSPLSYRRSSHINELQRGKFTSLLTFTPTQKPENDYHVLVYDTPEEDYGLTYCQRRLRSLRHHRRKLRSKLSTAH